MEMDHKTIMTGAAALMMFLGGQAANAQMIPQSGQAAEAQMMPQEEQTEMQKVFTLKECMEYAISNSTKVRIQQATNGDNQVARRDAILAAFTPSVSGNAYVYSNFGRTIDPESNTYISSTSFNNAWSVSAGINLFNGFEAVNNLRITKTSKAMGISQEQQIKDQICLATIEAYCNVVYYTRLSGILQDQVKTAENSLKLAKRQEELGQKGYADVVQMAADLADKEYQLVTAQNSLNDAYITLKDVMFWPITEPLEIDGSIAEDADWQYEGILQNEADEKTMIEKAKSTLPDIFIAKGTMDNAKMELRTAKWQIAPSLSLYAGWSTSYYTYPGQQGYVTTPFWNQFKNNGGEYVQLSLSIPIFDRLSRHSNVARKKNAYRRATAEYEQKVREVEAEVSRAIQDRDGASAAFIQADKRADVQEEAYKLNKKKFEQGLISSIEYHTASDTYLNAMAERLNALLQYQIKKKVVAYYNGIHYLDQE